VNSARILSFGCDSNRCDTRELTGPLCLHTTSSIVPVSIILLARLMRFSLIDKITELNSGESIVAVKNVSLAEEYLQDHFPGFPILPGVMMVEALVQTSAWLMRQSEEFKFSTVLLKEAKAVKFNSFVSPGKTLVISSKVQKKGDREWTFKATGHMGDTNTVSARLVLEQFNAADTNEKLAPMDELQVEKMQELFHVLWQPQA